MYKQTNTICKPKCVRLFALIIICTIIMKTKSRFSRNIYAIVTKYFVTNISGTQPRKYMITMGKVDTSDLMMIITWAMDISLQSPKLKCASSTYTYNHKYSNGNDKCKYIFTSRVSCRLKSTTRELVHADFNENDTFPHYWRFMWECSSGRWKSPSNGGSVACYNVIMDLRHLCTETRRREKGKWIWFIIYNHALHQLAIEIQKAVTRIT